MRRSSLVMLLVVVLGACGSESDRNGELDEADEGSGSSVGMGETAIAGSAAPMVMGDDQGDELGGQAGSVAPDMPVDGEPVAGEPGADPEPMPAAGAGGAGGSAGAMSMAGSGGSTSSAGSGGSGGSSGASSAGTGGMPAAGQGGSGGSIAPAPTDTACKVQGWNTYRCSARQYFPDYTMTWTSTDGASTFTCDSVSPAACKPGAKCKVFRPSSPGTAMEGTCQ